MTFRNSIISLVSLFVCAGIYCGVQNYQYPATNNNYFSTYPYSSLNLTDLMLDVDNSPFAGASAPPMEENYSFYRPSNTIPVQTQCNLKNSSAVSFVVGITVASAAYLLMTYLWHRYNKSFWPYKRYDWSKIEYYVDSSSGSAAKIQVLTARDVYEGDWLATN